MLLASKTHTQFFWDTPYSVSVYFMTFKLIDGMKIVVLMVVSVNITVLWDVFFVAW
jgi:hypothetical protein